MACSRIAIVGSGINALVAAAMLSKKGHEVTVFERNDRAGGCIRSDEITAPGYIHDVLAATFVLFLVSPAYGELAEDLAAHGLEFCHSPHPTAVLRPNGKSQIIAMDRAANIAAFEKMAAGDGAAWQRTVSEVEGEAELLFAMLGQPLMSRKMAWMLARRFWSRGITETKAFFGQQLQTARHWLDGSFADDTNMAALAPWVLHTGLGPEAAYSGAMARIIAFTLEAAGAPIVKGGAAQIVAAFEGVIKANGGAVRVGQGVASIEVSNGRAVGVRLADGEVFKADHVIASVTPHQLYGRLVDDVPDGVEREVSAFRYGKGNFQLHYALKSPPKWKSAGLEDVALIHLSDGVDAVSKASNEAERGMLPEVPTICVGQPTALDPTRAPKGGAILWLQMPEAPRHIKGDAAGSIKVGSDGKWSEHIREAWADRIEAILRTQIDNFDDIIIARRALSPADLASINVNLVDGDPYGGYCGLDQFFAWRPLKSTVNHATHVRNLWHVGASTHPGPGLGGGSGYLIAKQLQ